MFRKIAGASLAAGRRLAHTLPELPYEYNALEPVISHDIMRLHHTKHHAAYVTNYNAAEQKLKEAVQNGDTNTIITLQNVIKFNGGGHLNHSIFWTNLSPQGGGLPTGDLLEAITSKYGSFDSFKEQLTTLCVTLQGSGWGWLGYDKRTRLVDISTTQNQDPLQATSGGHIVPLMGIDVWEHAYYLQYKNARADYVHAIWNIINWENVAERLHNAKMKYS